MKFGFIIFALTISVFVLNMSCKKYPEDPFIPFRTSKCRLEGEWQLERIEINDENVGYKYNDSLAPLTFKDFKFWFKFGVKTNNATGSKAKVDLLMINKSSKKEKDALKDPDVSGFDFGLDPKNERLAIAGESTKKRFPIKDENAHKIFTNLFVFGWDVQTLYNKTLVIEGTSDNVRHRLYFKKTRNN